MSSTKRNLLILAAAGVSTPVGWWLFKQLVIWARPDHIFPEIPTVISVILVVCIFGLATLIAESGPRILWKLLHPYDH